MSRVSGTLPERPLSWSIPAIDSMISGISDSLMNAGVASFPPGWTSELSAVHKRSKAAFRNWCISGKAANSSDPLKLFIKMRNVCSVKSSGNSSGKNATGFLSP